MRLATQPAFKGAGMPKSPSFAEHHVAVLCATFLSRVLCATTLAWPTAATGNFCHAYTHTHTHIDHMGVEGSRSARALFLIL